jgi:hypothetical protein
MLTAILVFLIFNTLFTMALVGHVATVEKLMKALTEAKIAEMKMFDGK